MCVKRMSSRSCLGHFSQFACHTVSGPPQNRSPRTVRGRISGPPDRPRHCKRSPWDHLWHYRWSPLAADGPPIYPATNAVSTATILILCMMEDSSKLYERRLWSNQQLQAVGKPSHLLTSSHVHVRNAAFATAPRLLITLQSG